MPHTHFPCISTLKAEKTNEPSTVVLDVLFSGRCVCLFSFPVSALEVPLQPPNSRHLPLSEQHLPQHSDAQAASDGPWHQGGSGGSSAASPGEELTFANQI